MYPALCSSRWGSTGSTSGNSCSCSFGSSCCTFRPSMERSRGSIVCHQSTVCSVRRGKNRTCSINYTLLPAAWQDEKTMATTRAANSRTHVPFLACDMVIKQWIMEKKASCILSAWILVAVVLFDCALICSFWGPG